MHFLNLILLISLCQLLYLFLLCRYLSVGGLWGWLATFLFTSQGTTQAGASRRGRYVKILPSSLPPLFLPLLVSFSFSTP